MERQRHTSDPQLVTKDIRSLLLFLPCGHPEAQAEVERFRKEFSLSWSPEEGVDTLGVDCTYVHNLITQQQEIMWFKGETHLILAGMEEDNSIYL